MRDAVLTREGFDKSLKILKEQSEIVQNISLSQIHAVVHQMAEVQGLKNDAQGQSAPGVSFEGKSYVPQLLSSNFMGRDLEIGKLDDALTSNMESQGRRRTAVFGMTGVGKSQLVNPVRMSTEFLSSFYDISS